MKIDTSYKTDYSSKDPDGYDKNLRDQHQLLWSKPSPCGRIFDLKTDEIKPYKLLHKFKSESFSLSSDAITHTYTYWDGKPAYNMDLEIIEKIPREEIDAFFDLGCSIGGYIVFPSNQIDGKQTINQARGSRFSPIKDRFDLTLECIRRWYIDEQSPLFDCLERYRDFFELFKDFKGYVDFFLLDALVDENGQVKFWLDFEDFGITSPLPKTPDEYRKYMGNVSDFVKERNDLIDMKYNKNKGSD